MKKVWAAIANRIWLGFLLACVICLILSVVVQASYGGKAAFTFRYSPAPGWLSVAFAVVAVLDALLVLWGRKRTHWSSAGYSLDIVHPKEGAKCDVAAPFSGTLTKKLPRDSHLWLLRRFSEDGPYYVDKEIKSFTSSGGKNLLWNVEANVGGKPGDARYFEVWLTGEDSHRYFEQLKAMQVAFWEKAEKSTAGVKIFEPVASALSANIVLSDAVRVKARLVYRR